MVGDCCAGDERISRCREQNGVEQWDPIRRCRTLISRENTRGYVSTTFTVVAEDDAPINAAASCKRENAAIVGVLRTKRSVFVVYMRCRRVKYCTRENMILTLPELGSGCQCQWEAEVKAGETIRTACPCLHVAGAVL